MGGGSNGSQTPSGTEKRYREGFWFLEVQEGGGCTGTVLYENIYFAYSPEFTVGNFAPKCCEPAFGNARFAILKFFGLVFFGGGGVARNGVFS